MNFFIEHWQLFAGGIIIIVVGVMTAIGLKQKYDKMSTEEKIAMVRAWLLQLVMLLEKEFGSGTGKLKLSAAYDKFCERFPWLVTVITFAQFSELVDKALEEMRDLLDKNPKLRAYILNEPEG